MFVIHMLTLCINTKYVKTAATASEVAPPHGIVGKWLYHVTVWISKEIILTEICGYKSNINNFKSEKR